MLWVAFTGPWSTDKQETWAPALAVASFLQSTRWRLGRSRYCCLVPRLHSRTAYCLAYNGPCQGLLFINPVKLRPAYVGCYGSYSLAHAHRVEGHRLEQRPIDTFPFRLSIYIIPATCLRLLHVCRLRGGWMPDVRRWVEGGRSCRVTTNDWTDWTKLLPRDELNVRMTPCQLNGLLCESYGRYLSV